jgi:chromate reductase
MATKPTILALAGSKRSDSFNRKLLRIAADGARAAGGEVTLVEMDQFPLPLFDQDEEGEHGLPENARKLKTLMRSHQGLLISSPEYNSSITPLLKNAIDWTSRAETGEPPLVCFRGKIAVVMSASPGALGGLRGLVHLRAILGNIGTLVLPNTISISQAMNAFDAAGRLADTAQQSAVEKLGAELVAFLQRIAD